MYLWIGVPINLWTNRVLINTLSVPPASALFVPSDFCLLALIVAVPLVRAKTTTRTPSRRLLFLRLSAPVFLPLTTILASMILAVSSHHHVAGIAFGIAGLAIFGVRSAYGQFQLLATQSSLESANQDLEALSKRDPLTGLYNRRWFSEAYTLAWQRAQRSRQPLSLVLIDVDHFKLFNDTLGHAAGDFCLESIAKALSSKLHRVGDALVRYGGEELLAILENTDSEGAQHVAQMFLDSVSKLQLPHPASPFNCVTISIGFATCSDPQPEFTRDDLLLQADQALYTAKREGRNCIRSTAATTHPSAESDPPTSSNEPRPL
jgi:diguanylate cyclase (GGDEF)-like protein